MKKKNPIDEARRYVSNARKTLSENGELDIELQIYSDPKYVRSAGNYLWLGVLMALDTIVDVRKDRRTRPDINAYKEAWSRRDRKLLTMVNDGYDIMHLYMNLSHLILLPLTKLQTNLLSARLIV